MDFWARTAASRLRLLGLGLLGEMCLPEAMIGASTNAAMLSIGICGLSVL